MYSTFRILFSIAALLLAGWAHAQSRPQAAAGGQAPDLRVAGVAETLSKGGAAGAGALAAPPVRDYRIGPNDLLDIEVFDLDSVKRTLRVNAVGGITLPLIGQVTVAGLTSLEAEQRIADKYREKYLQNPQVAIFIKEFTTERITVEGAVAKPGIYPLSGHITLLRALAMAGGFGPIANASEVMLFRVNEQKQREVAVFDITQIRAGKVDDPAIRGDDLIVVQQDAARKVLKDSLLRDVIESINPFSVFSR